MGFEPTERFPAHSISSAANSTTLAPLQGPRDCRFSIADCRLKKPPLVTRQSAIKNRQSAMSWRRGWDSNPRWAFTHSGFRDRCTNPLCDLSNYATRRIGDQRGAREILPPQSPRHPASVSSLSCRLPRKNRCITARHSASSTPDLISIR